MLTKSCPLCQEQVLFTFFEKHVYRERTMIRRMKEDHPEWMESDGACHRCLDEYKKVHDDLLHQAKQIREARGETYDTVDEDFREEYDEFAVRAALFSPDEE